MSSPSMSQKASLSSPILGSYEAYGCRVNAIDPADLFQRYRQANFLYEDKLRHLAPFMPEILDNWRRGMDAGNLIHHIVTYQNHHGAWASLTSWRSTHTGWHAGHLVSLGGPAASRAVLLAAQAERMRDLQDRAAQNWFQPSNRYANHVFGSVVESIGPEHAWVGRFNYLWLSLEKRPPGNDQVAIVPCPPSKGSDLFELAVKTRGRVYAIAEELDHEDLLLDAVDALYASVGLRRYRRVWLAMLKGHDAVVGAAIAYRGPLGFNFSLLESRCDLLIDPTLNNAHANAVTQALVETAATVYKDFPPRVIPLVTDDPTSSNVVSMGGRLIR